MTQRETCLPAVFGKWAHAVSYVQANRNATKFTSECPSCGGVIHEDHTLPDRCIWWLTSQHNSPMGYCKHCKKTFWPDSNISDEEKAEARRYVQEQLDARARHAKETADAFRDSRKWELWHEQMGQVGRQKWLRRGVPETYQDFWQLGVGTYNIHTDAGWVTSPTLTIPLFDHEWNCMNVKHRLEKATDYGGKYRAEIAGMGTQLFLCNPGEPLKGHVIVVEGEIKACVAFATLDDSNTTMVGLPGASPSPTIVGELKEAESVTLVLDPGAQQQAMDLATTIGRRRCRILIPSMKLDDGILASGMTAHDVRVLLQSARAA